MRARIVVIGGGEHARVVIEAIRSGGGAQEVIGFVDPEPCEETTRRLRVPRLGGEDILVEHPARSVCWGSRPPTRASGGRRR